MLVLRLLTTLTLSLMFIQDLKSRSIVWPLFPVLAICGFFIQFLLHYPAREILQFSLLNLLFLLIQYLCIVCYFRITRGSGTKITDTIIGWGDLCFLLCAAFFLPTMIFIIYYTSSLLAVLIGWSIYRALISGSSKQIPLAGSQAIILLILAAGDWIFGWYNLYDEQFLFSLIG